MIKVHKYNHFVTNEKDAAYRQMFEAHAHDYIGKTTELWSIGVTKSILLDDIGYSFLPFRTVKDEVENGTLKVISHNFKFDMFRSLLLTRKQNWQNPLVEQFIEQTKEHFKR